MKATRLLLILAMALGMPSGAQVTNGLLVNSFETSADLLRFTRNNCSVSSSTEGVTDGLKAALVVFSNVDWPNLHFKVGTGFANGDWRDWGAVAVDILNINPASVTVDRSYSPGLSGELPFGLTYDLTMPITDQTYPNSLYTTSPELTLKQPILKNFLIDSPRYQIRLSRQTLRSDQQGLRLQMETSINSVKTAYFNLIAARESVEVQRAAVTNAHQLVT